MNLRQVPQQKLLSGRVRQQPVWFWTEARPNGEHLELARAAMQHKQTDGAAWCAPVGDLGVVEVPAEAI